jgi:hypothetical protein
VVQVGDDANQDPNQDQAVEHQLDGYGGDKKAENWLRASPFLSDDLSSLGFCASFVLMGTLARKGLHFPGVGSVSGYG